MEYSTDSEPSLLRSTAGSSSSSGNKSSSPPLVARVQEKVAQIYYKHGLLCSSHPWIVIFISFATLLFCCYPILGVHLVHGSSSQQLVTPLQELEESGSSAYGPIGPEDPASDVSKSLPRWFASGPPFAYIQHIVIKSAVIPWQSNLILMDAIRAPLSQVFPLTEFISNHHLDYEESRSVSLGDNCFQVSEPVAITDSMASSLLPRYSCLLVSPANVWKNDLNKFLQDATIIKTLFSVKDLASLDSSGSLREVLFGVPWMETGIRRLYVRTRQRTITYAVTMVFSKYDADFIQSLSYALRERYPTNPFPNVSASSDGENGLEEVQEIAENVTHLHFQDQFSFSEYVPLGATYCMLFCYIYFSVRKIDLIKCKWALALGSVATVILSLFMSIGICLWFDFNPTLNRSDILPYLVLVIGLENMLVLTKSVVSTPAHLDIKVRVAQGLSREGWSITKNLICELGLLTFGFFTFVPIIQEFCLFGMVGLLSDFFLQLSFFTTILSIDIQRIEINGRKKSTVNYSKILTQHKKMNENGTRLSPSHEFRPRPTNVFARPVQPTPFKLPKRLRLVYFWARTRMIHRTLMVCLVIWISLLVYKSGLVEHLSSSETRHFPSFAQEKADFNDNPYKGSQAKGHSNQGPLGNGPLSSGPSVSRLEHRNAKLWGHLSTQHWAALFGYYNISLSGKYISILPPIHLSIPVEPSAALTTRHPSESDPQIFRQFLSPSGGVHSAFDDTDDEYAELPIGYHTQWSKREIAFIVALSIPTFSFIVYILVTLYRCMCSRHYAEWRTSWSHTLRSKVRRGSKAIDSDLVFETVAVKLQGHEQDIELITSSTESPFVSSCCMQGDVRIWDVLSGECHTFIRRTLSPNPCKQSESTFKPQHKPSGSFSSDSTYGSSPGNGSGDHLLDFASGSLEPNSSQFNSSQFNHRHSLPSQQTSPSTEGSAYNFAPYYSRLNSSRNVMTDIILSAFSSNSPERGHEISANTNVESPLSYKSIWSMDIFGKLVFIGCESGRLEVWDALTGHLCYYNETNSSGVTVLRANSCRLVVGYLNGVLELYELEPCNGYSSSPSPSPSPSALFKQSFQYSLIQSVRASLQPITALQLEASHVVTGSLDHMLKVYRIDTGACVYTLHGHYGGITNIHIDQTSPASAISGCTVGQVNVWDLMTGTCVFSLEAHQGASVSSLLATLLYVISAGTDNRICIWDKYSGHLVHTIHQHHSISNDMVLLAPNILVTAKEDHLVLWDISEAHPLRVVLLDPSGEKKSYIKNLRLSSQSRAVACDFGSQMCVIHFPGVAEKCD